MTRFEPIAIVGQGCVLPGAHTPDALADLVMQGRTVYGPVNPTELGLAGNAIEGRTFVSGRIAGFGDVPIHIDDEN